MDFPTISLYHLNKKIQESTKKAFPDNIWVVAEILEIQANRSGHCYMELVEKSDSDDRIIARSRATIWSYKYNILRPYFETTTGKSLQAGIKVLLKAEVSFHEIYGLSLNISDIDPAFTLGDLEMKKRETIKKLEKDGVINMNRELLFPIVPQRVAVISAESAAGYGDFLDSINKNTSHIRFSLSFFPAVMQGEAAAASVISAFEEIFIREEEFDVVVLIRGGGSKADLDCFNNYELALNIAQFPLPVITGIGHERDETIADIVANSSLKTPTATAEFLINKMIDFLNYLYHLEEKLNQQVSEIILEKKNILSQKSSDLGHLLKRYLSKEDTYLQNVYLQLNSSIKNQVRHKKFQLERYSEKSKYIWKNVHSRHRSTLEELYISVNNTINNFFINQKDKLTQSERSLELLRPEKVIERGYSITYVNGKIVKSVSKVRKDDKLTTTVRDGTITSTVKELTKK